MLMRSINFKYLLNCIRAKMQVIYFKGVCFFFVEFNTYITVTNSMIHINK